LSLPNELLDEQDKKKNAPSSKEQLINLFKLFALPLAGIILSFSSLAIPAILIIILLYWFG